MVLRNSKVAKAQRNRDRARLTLFNTLRREKPVDIRTARWNRYVAVAAKLRSKAQRDYPIRGNASKRKIRRNQFEAAQRAANLFLSTAGAWPNFSPAHINVIASRVKARLKSANLPWSYTQIILEWQRGALYAYRRQSDYGRWTRRRR